LSKPLVSFILAVRNGDKHLDSCIKSVINQSFTNWELIIVVNCSSDSSLTIAETYQTKNTRIKVIESNIGQLNHNLNLGLQVAEGLYIARIDADDVNYNNRIEIQVKLMADYHIVGSAVELVDEDGNNIGAITFPEFDVDIRKKIYYRSVIAHPTVMIRRDVLLAVGGYQGGQRCEDYDLWLRLMRDEKYKFYNHQLPLLQYRCHSNQMSSGNLSFAYVASYLLREAILMKSFKYFLGFLIYVLKFTLKRKQ
jgi:O86/O127-antigen biosynthesis beta-1,3-galactosyltransferase